MRLSLDFYRFNANKKKHSNYNELVVSVIKQYFGKNKL